LIFIQSIEHKEPETLTDHEKHLGVRLIKQASSGAEAKQLTSFLLPRFQEARLLVLDDSYGQVDSFTLQDSLDTPLDLPFRVTALELTTELFPIVTSPDSGDNGDIHWILIAELETGDYEFVLGYADLRDSSHKTLDIINQNHEGRYRFIKSYIKNLLVAINNKKTLVGESSLGYSVKYSVGGLKGFYKPTKTIICGQKSAQVKLEHLSQKPIEWRQCWDVRGHWRKHNGIGKDRFGIYNRTGFTWVKEHIKGDVQSPVVKKTRVFQE
jgi:transposase-like protein